MTLDEDKALADYLRASRKGTPGEAQAQIDAIAKTHAPLLRYEQHFGDAATASAH